MTSKMNAILREQTAFEHRQWDTLASGIILLALEEPDMPRCLIAERFGQTPGSVKHLLDRAGVRWEPDHYSASLNGKRRMAG